MVTPISMQPTRSANDTAEYRSNYEAGEYVNALYALDHGWTGKGVTIGLIDDGFNAGASSELTNKVDASQSKDFGFVTQADGTSAHHGTTGDSNSVHGTSVGAIIVAAHDGQGVEGFAPDARLAVLRVDDEVVNSNGTTTRTYDYADAAISYAATEKLKIVNMSLATSTADSGTVAAMNSLAATGGLVINSAGNSGGAQPEEAANVTDANRKAWLFVGALEPNGTGYQLASYSNKAGALADRYVVAPGTNVTIDVNGTKTTFAGTSSATPVVTALAADILSKWPQLSGQDAGNIILATAKPIGDKSIFGAGLVDFQAALSPVNPTLSNGTVAASVPVSSSAMVVPSIMSPQSIANALTNVTVLDQFGRNYQGNLAQAVIQPASTDGHWIRRRIQQMSQGGVNDMQLGGFTGSFGYVTTNYGSAYTTNRQDLVQSRMTFGEMSYHMDAWDFHAGINASQNIQSDIMGLAPFSDAVLAYSPMADTSIGASYRMGEGRRLGITFSTGAMAANSYVQAARTQAVTLSYQQRETLLRFSMIREEGSVFGYASAGALAIGRGETSAVLEARHSFNLAGGWSLQGYGSLGLTRLSIDGSSVVTGASTLLTTRMGLQADGPLLGGVLSLGVAQPLRVEKGSAHLTVPTGYDYDSTSLIYSHENASLAADKREVQFTAGFAHAVHGGSIRLGVTQAVNVNDRRAMAGWSMHF